MLLIAAGEAQNWFAAALGTDFAMQSGADKDHHHVGID
jgi:hypothetical protein